MMIIKNIQMKNKEAFKIPYFALSFATLLLVKAAAVKA